MRGVCKRTAGSAEDEEGERKHAILLSAEVVMRLQRGGTGPGEVILSRVKPSPNHLDDCCSAEQNTAEEERGANLSQHIFSSSKHAHVTLLYNKIAFFD